MKKVKQVAALLLGATCALSTLTACGGGMGGGGKVKAEATEIVIKCRRAGFHHPRAQSWECARQAPWRARV